MVENAIWPVILSGGVGARLWPLSRASTPKQLLPLVSEYTMIQETARRAVGPGFAAPIVVAGAMHGTAIVAQLEAIETAPATILLEPEGRNTAPAIALAAHWLARNGGPLGKALMLVMPSDHVVTNTPAFLRAIAAAEPFARDGWLVTFGIRAHTPETGYGYIRLGANLGGGVQRVEAFVEKPSFEIAERFVEGGHHAWNGGIFLMRADRYLEELGAHAPDILHATRAALAGAAVEGITVVPEARRWAGCPSDSIDYAVMEKADRVAVVPVDMGWSDIGNWDALHALVDGDQDGNVVRGDTVVIDSRDCLIRSEGPLIATVGLDGVTIVATADAVLVVARGRAQDVKRVVDRLKAAGRDETERLVKELVDR